MIEWYQVVHFADRPEISERSAGPLKWRSVDDIRAGWPEGWSEADRKWVADLADGETAKEVVELEGGEWDP